jgi:DNA-binding NarL/FixJ family response regulator
MSVQHRQEACVLHLTGVSPGCVRLRLSADRGFGRRSVRDAPDVTKDAGEPSPAGPTEREGQILVLIGNGLSNREITEQMFIGTATVQTHINRIFAKIGIGDRRGAIAYAVSHRLSTRGSPGAEPAT